MGSAAIVLIIFEEFEKLMKRFLRFSFTQSKPLLIGKIANALVAGDRDQLQTALSRATSKKDVKEGRVMTELLAAILHASTLVIDDDGCLHVTATFRDVSGLGDMVPAVSVSAGGIFAPEGTISIRLSLLQPDNYPDGARAYRTAAVFCAIVTRLIGTERWASPQLTSVRDTVGKWRQQIDMAQRLWTCESEPAVPQAAAQALEELLGASSIRLATDSFCVLLLPVATHVHAMFGKESRSLRYRTLKWANEALSPAVRVSFYYDWESLRYPTALSDRSSQHDRPIERVAARLKESDGFEDRYALVLSKLSSDPAPAIIEEPPAESSIVQLANRVCIPLQPLCVDVEELARKKSWRIIGHLEPVGSRPQTARGHKRVVDELSDDEQMPSQSPKRFVDSDDEPMTDPAHPAQDQDDLLADMLEKAAWMLDPSLDGPDPFSSADSAESRAPSC